jgi:hypothetical protein
MFKNTIKLTVPFTLLLIAFAAMTFEAKAQWETPTQPETEQARKSGPCNDPWITIAFKRRWSRIPAGYRDMGECNISLYNGGSWNSFSQLYDYLVDYKRAMDEANSAFKFVKMSDSDYRIGLAFDGKVVVDPSNIVALGGNNIIANGGNKIIANGGNNIIAPGGGNFSITKGYGVQSGAKKVINLKGSQIVVR